MRRWVTTQEQERNEEKNNNYRERKTVPYQEMWTALLEEVPS